MDGVLEGKIHNDHLGAPEQRTGGNLDLHVRSVPGEDMVNLYLGLLDGTVITLNR